MDGCLRGGACYPTATDASKKARMFCKAHIANDIASQDNVSQAFAAKDFPESPCNKAPDGVPCSTA